MSPRNIRDLITNANYARFSNYSMIYSLQAIWVKQAYNGFSKGFHPCHNFHAIAR
jgi:hypothetical protein